MKKLKKKDPTKKLPVFLVFGGIVLGFILLIGVFMALAKFIEYIGNLLGI